MATHGQGGKTAYDHTICLTITVPTDSLQTRFPGCGLLNIPFSRRVKFLASQQWLRPKQVDFSLARFNPAKRP